MIESVESVQTIADLRTSTRRPAGVIMMARGGGPSVIL